MSNKTLDERVDRIEKIFWVVAALALIFGISGAWGLSALKNAKSQINSIRSFVEDVESSVVDGKLQIKTEKERQLKAMKPEVRAMAQKEINEIAGQLKARIAYSKPGKCFLGRHSFVSLPVKKGDIVYASYVASARNSEFHYRIVCENGLATPLIKRDQCVMAAPLPDKVNYRHQWHSISASEVFRVHTNGDLKLAAEFLKGHLTGGVDVFGSTLVAFKVALESDIP